MYKGPYSSNAVLILSSVNGYSLNTDFEGTDEGTGSVG